MSALPLDLSLHLYVNLIIWQVIDTKFSIVLTIILHPTTTVPYFLSFIWLGTCFVSSPTQNTLNCIMIGTCTCTIEMVVACTFSLYKQLLKINKCYNFVTS